MFGRQNDITIRDQKQSVDVPLPDDAIAAITGSSPSDDTSFANSPLMQDDDPVYNDHLDSMSKTTQHTAPELPAQTPAAAPRRLTNSDLLDIKRSALHELSPIIDVLDGKPEEKFRTIIELIQSTDNQALLPAALTIAKEIPDKQTRAHALLAIINETNYFSKHNVGL